MPGQSSKVFQPLTKEEREEMKVDALSKASSYLDLLKSYLKDNAASIPAYNSTSCYQTILSQNKSPYQKNMKGSIGFYPKS
jgi:hypothetical protein